MILKNPPQVFFSGGKMNKQIGAPNDYAKNKEAGEFPNESITISASPVNASQSSTNMENKRVGAKVSSQVEEAKPVKEESKDREISQPVNNPEAKLLEPPS